MKLKLLPFNNTRADFGSDTGTYFMLILISIRAIKVTVTGVDSIAYSLRHFTFGRLKVM